jgi:hypothetical protein
LPHVNQPTMERDMTNPLMNREDWNEALGGGSTVTDDLEYTIYVARYCRQKQLIAENPDEELVNVYRFQIADARAALSGLYRR